MSAPQPTIQAFLLDVEGTTTPVDYVFGVLFPFARDQVESYLAQYGQKPDVQLDLQRLRQEYESDRQQNLPIPPWSEGNHAEAVPYIHYLISIDRKSTGLKSLQGKLWEQGYQNGTLRSQLFPDVRPALIRWHQAGQKIYIYSSGSVQAQKLLFRYSNEGDLTEWIDGYFDTQIGPKRIAESYQNIAQEMGLHPTQILFISDVVAELQAAQAVEMQTRFALRPGNPAIDPQGFKAIQTFEAL